MELRDVVHRGRSNDVKTKRGYCVVKSNDFIHSARFDLSLFEQKILLFMISKLKPEHDRFHEYVIKISEYLAVFGMSDAGKNYAGVKRSLKALSDKSFWLSDAEHDEKLLRFFNTVHIDAKEASIKVTFHEDMRPYLLQLRRNYTKYCLEWVLPFTSKYSIPLYEFLKMSSFKRSVLDVNIADLKDLINYTNKGGDFNNFRRRVLDPCIREINMYTDLNVRWEAAKTGNKYSEIYFICRQSDAYEVYMNQRKYFAELHQKVRRTPSFGTG